MSRALRLTLGASAAAAAALWTLAAVGAWWLLQAAAGTLEGSSTAAILQAVTAWTERPWVRHWLDPHEADALRDGVDWLLGLGGGPAAWVGSALTLMGIALLVVWVGGLALAALAALIAIALSRRLIGWWRTGERWPWTPRQSQTTPVEGQPAV